MEAKYVVPGKEACGAFQPAGQARPDLRRCAAGVARCVGNVKMIAVRMPHGPQAMNRHTEMLEMRRGRLHYSQCAQPRALHALGA